VRAVRGAGHLRHGAEAAREPLTVGRPAGQNGVVPSDSPVHVVVLDRGRELTGVAREGESWAAAARRTCASMHAEPEPLDLSRETKRLALDPGKRSTVPC